MPLSAEVDGFRLACDRAGSGRRAGFFTRSGLRGVDGAGHFMPLEAPSAFAAAVFERCQESERP